MAITLKVSDLLSMAQELANDGFEYIDVSEEEPDDEIEFPGGLSISAYDTYSMNEYGDIEQVEVPDNYTR